MEKLLAWKSNANKVGVPLFIDCAAGFGANFDHLQNEILVADAVIYSMHATKTFSVGEGGIIVGKKDIIDVCTSLSNFGFKEDRSFSQYGTNSKISEIMCATALAALDSYSDQLSSRQNIFSSYLKRLESVEELSFQEGYENCAWQSLFIQVNSEINLLKVKSALLSNEIQFRNDWSMPTHLSVESPLGPNILENTNKLALGALTLPIWIGISDLQIKFVAEVIKRALIQGE
jgi:dTDP-4-amino-4,6-dideoxygalactose transaminase